MKDNIVNLFNELLEIDKIGVDEIRILKLVNHGSATNNWSKIGLTLQEQYDAVKMIIANREQFAARLSFSGFPIVEKCRPFESTCICGAGKTLLYIDSLGEIFPCASMKNNHNYSLGNIKYHAHIKSLPYDISPCLKEGDS